ncbi:ankyrin repeat and LEM domain-containing protein 2-like [Argiope bruennichi]|uniref:ankyrin repeat and LEM domain-containing protein 2-like n=1 Tax=Argiope bruennichi TaxID=94029 RepID=UPI00249514B3|nr:ankyrin repeat and LEM domain-containing protein 2-like [Argiope bruennichi]
MENNGPENNSENLEETVTGPEASYNTAINTEEYSEEDFIIDRTPSESGSEDELDPSSKSDYSAQSDEGSSCSVTSEDMLLMRGFIKNGEIENFSQFIWNCPGIFYCGDLLPTVTHEDAQYNLLQLATVLNSPLFCQVILDILQHPRFARRLFPNKTDDERSKEITKIIDMYLNSGSDETGDTPLHYASKLGYTDCCKILLANPLCKTLINHSGFTPLSLMFEKDSNQLKQVLTDGLLYVPIFRSYEDLQPFVGRPTNCKELKSLENFQDFGTEQMCKKHSLYFLNAFAGPMSSEMANKFYITLNDPSSCSLFTYEELMHIHLIKQQEPNRGLERIGRCLAQENELLKRQNGHWRKLKQL